jgi:hypothetical protein
MRDEESDRDAPGDDQESLRGRSEQAIGELAQALLDSQVLENALAAAFGAREKAAEAQQAAMSALNLPSAGDVERLERRLRSLSRRLEEVEDQLDAFGRDVAELRRELRESAPPETASSTPD